MRIEKLNYLTLLTLFKNYFMKLVVKMGKKQCNIYSCILTKKRFKPDNIALSSSTKYYVVYDSCFPNCLQLKFYQPDVIIN